jgi:hypothetical protein
MEEVGIKEESTRKYIKHKVVKTRADGDCFYEAICKGLNIGKNNKYDGEQTINTRRDVLKEACAVVRLVIKL